MLTDRARGVATDAGVDLVEHQQRPSSKLPRTGRAAVSDAEEREHHPRELAARGDLAQRPGRQPGVRRDQKLDGVGPRGSRTILPLGAARPRIGRPPSPARPAATAPRRRAAARPGAVAALSFPPIRSRSPTASASSARAPSERHLEVEQLRLTSSAALGMRQYLGDPASVLARQPGERRQPLLDVLERSRRLGALGPGQVRAQLRGRGPRRS